MTIAVRQLGYLGFNVTDLSAWQALATDVLGMLATESDDATLLLKMDAFQRRIALHSSDQDGLAYAGWEVRDEDELDGVTAQVEALGTSVTDGDDALKDARGVMGLRHFADPEGIPTEIFYGPLVTDERKVPRLLQGRFVTGDLGLGHMTYSISDRDRCVEFYLKGLGFRLSGSRIVQLDGAVAKIAPMRCNRRHHSLNVLEIPAPPHFMHLGIQLEDLDDLGIAMDRALERDLVEVPLGRHQADHMLSFYLKTPSGFQIELGWGGRELDDDHRVEQFEGAEPSIWGHQGII